MKLFIALLAFSLHRRSPSSDLHPLDNRLEVLRIEHLYVELIWKYLLVEQDLRHAVKRFVHLIRCVLLLNKAIDEAQQIDQHRQIIDQLLQRLNSTFEH